MTTVAHSPLSPISNAVDMVRAYVSCVFRPDDIVEVRRLPSARSTWHLAAELVSIVAELQADNDGGENVYVGANPRDAPSGTDEASVALARCLFCDFDNGTTVAEAMAKIKAAVLPEP